VVICKHQSIEQVLSQSNVIRYSLYSPLSIQGNDNEQGSNYRWGSAPEPQQEALFKLLLFLKQTQTQIIRAPRSLLIFAYRFFLSLRAI